MSWIGLAIYSFGCWVTGLLALRVAVRLGWLAEWSVAERARGKTYLCYGIATVALTLAFTPGIVLAVEHRAVTYTPELVLFLVATSSVTMTSAAIGFADPLRRALRLRADAVRAEA